MFLKTAAFWLFTFVSLAKGVEIRVATFNIGAHLKFPVGGAAYFDYGIGPPGQPDHDAVRAVLARIDADVVALEEIHSTDFSSGNLTTLATGLGYPYVSFAPMNNAFDPSLHVAILSRFPFLSQALISSPAGSRDMTRLIPVVKIDVPETSRDLVVIGAHLKVGTSVSDTFQRTVEMHRLTRYLNSSGLTTSDNFIILGDFNFNPTANDRTFTAVPSNGLPSTFVLGTDMPLPIDYFSDPSTYFSTPAVTRIIPRQLDQSIVTRPSTTAGSGGTSIDLLMVSPTIRSRPLHSEIYNSALDLSNDSGLTKGGLPLAGGTSATASDHLALFCDVELDPAVPYTFTSAGQIVSETFDQFSGTCDPYPWVTSGGAWKGIDSGTAAAAGFRSYGPATDPSIGFIPGTTGGSATASFLNQSSKTITALEISYTAEQWRSVSGGTPDSLSADLILNGVANPIPALTFTAANNLATGAIAGSTSTLKSTMVTGLSITQGDEFQLRFNFSPDRAVDTAPADIFVNEFHYDNVGTDQGEFIEVVAGPGFLGEFADIDVLLYDGSSGKVDRTINLGSSEFTRSTTPNGFDLFVIGSGIVIGNGLDGIAIVNRVTHQVIQFISYEGSFVATDGIASTTVPPSVSTNIGVSQTGSEAVGSSALGLVGSGGVRTDFAWAKIPGQHSKGAVNMGQTLVNNVPAPQGTAIDNLAVTFLTRQDTDGDGSPDADERVFGTDPLDSASRFTVSITQPSAITVRLMFPTLTGRNYETESSLNLSHWDVLGTYVGTGSPAVVDFPIPSSDPARFYRIRVTAP
jgi:endonuclease/exonuclease/phosphatase family metal-dependent hydrolase